MNIAAFWHSNNRFQVSHITIHPAIHLGAVHRNVKSDWKRITANERNVIEFSRHIAPLTRIFRVSARWSAKNSFQSPFSFRAGFYWFRWPQNEFLPFCTDGDRRHSITKPVKWLFCPIKSFLDDCSAISAMAKRRRINFDGVSKTRSFKHVITCSLSLLYGFELWILVRRHLSKKTHKGDCTKRNVGVHPSISTPDACCNASIVESFWCRLALWGSEGSK